MNPLLILFATQTGTAETCAQATLSWARSAGLHAQSLNMRDYQPHLIYEAQTLLFVASTWGEGEPPDDAFPCFNYLKTLCPNAWRDKGFAVFALGDTAYEQFCGFGLELDALAERLGAQRLLPVLKCDNDAEEKVVTWITQLTRIFMGSSSQAA